LLFAARSGDVESAKVLLAAGADVNLAAPDSLSPVGVMDCAFGTARYSGMLRKDHSGKNDLPIRIALTYRHASALAQRVVSQDGFHCTEQGLSVRTIKEQSSVFWAGFVTIEFAVSAEFQDLFQPVFERSSVSVSVYRLC